MALIPFVEKAIDYHTDLGVVMRLSRPYIWIELVDGDGNPFHRLAMYDSGAPLCVVPYSLWHEKKIP
jgi:hypothetical protein